MVKDNYGTFAAFVKYDMSSIPNLSAASLVVENGSLRGVNFPSRVLQRWVIWNDTPIYVVDCQKALGKNITHDELRNVVTSAVEDFRGHMLALRTNGNRYYAWACRKGQIMLYQTVKTRHIDAPMGKYNTF